MTTHAVAACAAFVWAGAAVASETSAVNAYNKVESARAQAFGGAAAGLGEDPTLAWVNPAAAGHARAPSFTLAGQRGYFRDVTASVLAVTPFKPGAVIAGVVVYDAGNGLGVYRPDGSPWTNPLQHDVLGAAGFALDAIPGITAGALVKAMHTRIADDAAGWGAVLDAGAHAGLGESLKVGVLVQNAGTRVTYLRDSVAPPMTVRVGGAVGMRLKEETADAEADPGSGGAVLAAMDAEYRIADHDAVWHVGAEYQWRAMVAVRMGVRLSSLREPASLSAGLGLLLNRFRLDYAIRYTQEYDLPQTVSVTFGPSSGAPRPSPAPETDVPVEPGM